MKTLFPLGQVFATPGARKLVPELLRRRPRLYDEADLDTRVEVGFKASAAGAAGTARPHARTQFAV